MQNGKVSGDMGRHQGPKTRWEVSQQSQSTVAQIGITLPTSDRLTEKIQGINIGNYK